MLTKAFIPYKGYYSSPFCRWQGSMANENSIELAAKTARNWWLSRKLDPAVLEYMYFGITIGGQRDTASRPDGESGLHDLDHMHPSGRREHRGRHL
jgi:hypothetical protein